MSLDADSEDFQAGVAGLRAAADGGGATNRRLDAAGRLCV